MQEKAIIYGDYTEPKGPAEYSILQFRAPSLTIDQLWENGFQSATYLSEFWAKFYSPYDKQVIADIENSIHYISAELIGNAVKYGFQSDVTVKVALSVPDSAIYFFVRNKVANADANEYQKYIKLLLNNNPQKMYIDQMEQNAIDNNSKSCIGFLTIMLDYGGNLGWKFEIEDQSEAITTTTTVRLPVSENLLPSSTPTFL